MNDRYGHAAGDATLIATANTLRQALRAQDLSARMGGEEFLLFLPGVKDQARAVAERLRLRIEAQTALHQDRAITVTASLGIAVAPSDGMVWEQLYQAADGALYEAKRQGRNRVVDHQELTASMESAISPSA